MAHNQNTSDLFRSLDTLWQAQLGKLTLGVSPASVLSAQSAWFAHMIQAPGKILELVTYPAFNGRENYARLWTDTPYGAPPSSPTPDEDPRFKSENWKLWPWRLFKHHFLIAQEWLSLATNDVPGLDDESERIISFATRQFMDAICPANFPATNPDLAFETLVSKGENLINGAKNAVADLHHLLTGSPPKGSRHFKVGRNLAITPGEVVFQNSLIELIKYTPQTETVYPEPLLITPAWIMKYYILDLSPHNSLVKWLVEKGHTVFMISWKNPGKEDAQLSMDDYQNLGIIAALNEIEALCPHTKIHLAGYCLGGTLAMITAATLALKGDQRLKSLTLLAAQGDFSHAGELMLFVNPSEVAFLKNMMRVQGYLDTRQMAGAFQMLRSYDLIWSKIINDYFHGLRRGDVDLMTWNLDATRMPYTMHSQYLERLYLKNEFSAGHYTVEGKAVAPENIQVPVFAVGADKDHVAPWQSVYKIHLMVNTEITFVLAKGGHNAGIVSEPGHKGRFYRQHVRKPSEPYLDASEWFEKAERHKDSWWLAWHAWLAQHSTSQKVPPSICPNPLRPAPGLYVLQR